jgi:hypothetical protein
VTFIQAARPPQTGEVVTPKCRASSQWPR